MKKIVLSFLSIIIILGLHAQTINYSVFVETSSDDAEETEDGNGVDISSSDLELIYDGENQTVGIRFSSVNIPSDAIIQNAYIQFNADGDYDETTSLIIKGEKHANSSAFEDLANNISSRPKTTSQTNWDNILPWIDLDAGELQQTPELSTIISEVISSNNWIQGNPITFIINGEGKRKAFSFDGNPELAPELVITYSPSSTIYNDLGISEITSPPELIFTNEEVEIEIQIINNGINSQVDFPVSYSINNETVITEIVPLTINSGESINYTFTEKANMNEVGEYTIEAQVDLTNDENLNNNITSSNITVIANDDALFFEQGATWKFLDNGSDQGTNWQELDFDDSQWSVGEGHMGFGEGDETTLLSSGYITYYFRKVINISDTSNLEDIFFNIVHDDGAIAYVNGNEVLRSAFMPSGEVNYLTGTTTFIPNDVENDFWYYLIDKSYFQNGENVIAIEIHNQTTSSSDISFDCYVSDTLEIEYKLDGPYVFYREGEVIVKTIESSGPNTYVYNSPEEANLICRFQNGVDSFAVQIQPELNIEPSNYTLPEKFLAISDIEGNLEAFVMLLTDAQVMDSNYNWTFDDGHLFFVGDMFDRGTNVTECLWLLYRLESQAIAMGGKIHFVMGNHDIMNLIYDFRYVAQKYITNSQLLDETLESIYATDTELGRWLRTKNIIEKVEPFIFLHGGVSPEVNALNLSYDDINYWGRYRMDNPCQTNECNIINGGSDYGLYWYRGMAEEDLSQQDISNFISNLDGDMVVLGHTVFENVTLLYEDQVICIDMDHEENYMNGFMSAFYYENGNLFDFHTDGTNQTYTLLKTITNTNEEVKNASGLNIKVFPNPCKSKSTIEYTIPNLNSNNNNKPPVNLSINNMMGVCMLYIVDKVQNPGTYQVDLDGSKLNPGVYYYHLSIENLHRSGKIIVSE